MVGFHGGGFRWIHKNHLSCLNRGTHDFNFYFCVTLIVVACLVDFGNTHTAVLHTTPPLAFGTSFPSGKDFRHRHAI